MNQKFSIFGVGILCLLCLTGFLNYNNAYSKVIQNNVKSKTNGYTNTVLSYDEEKTCTKDLNKSPNATEYLTYFNCGHIKIDEKNKTTTREFTLIVEENNTIPISNKGHEFVAWTYNGTVPGPTMRMTEGDNVKLTVINSGKNIHPHSVHMHSIHPGEADGVQGRGGTIGPGQNYTYSFIAKPFGVYPYHCHVDPVADHVNRGLYGMMIIDPKEHREKMHEFAMLMNGYDMNYSAEGPVGMPPVDKKDPTKLVDSGDKKRENQIYTVNGKAFEYVDHPIKLQVGEKYRIYLTNMLQFDLVNSFHLHGMMFNYMPSGTSFQPDYKNDIVTMVQGDRGILEFKTVFPGKYMFHAHQQEFTDKGWMGMFDVVDKNNTTL